MKIDKGKIYAVVGENGCGKTTFFNQLFKKYHNKKIIHIQQNDLLIKDFNWPQEAGSKNQIIIYPVLILYFIFKCTINLYFL